MDDTKQDFENTSLTSNDYDLNNLSQRIKSNVTNKQDLDSSSSEEETAYQCPKCPEIFDSLESYTIHAQHPNAHIDVSNATNDYDLNNISGNNNTKDATEGDTNNTI